MAKLNELFAYFLLSIIRFYRYFLSPWMGTSCRFFPTCSTYAKQAIYKYGGIRGGVLILKRVLKCHPWHPGGVDLIP